MNTDKPHVGTITIPLTPEQERQLREHAAACLACAKVNAGQAPPETRCADGNALIWSFGADLRNAAFEAASNVPTPPDWLTPKEREFKAVLAEHEERTRRTPLIPAHFFCVWTPGAPTIPGWYAFEWKSPDGKTHVSVGEHTEDPRALWVGGAHESVLKYRDTVTRHTPLQVPEAPENYGRPIMEAALRTFLAGGVKPRERGKVQNFGEGHPYGFGDRIAESLRSTIDAPPPPDLLEATRPEPSPYAKIYTNGEISPPSRIPNLGELCALRPYVNFAGSGGLVAAMAFAIHAEGRGTIPCPGRTVRGCGDGQDECELCGSQGEIPLSGPLPSEHPDPFVRDVIAAVEALAEASASTDENMRAAAKLFGVLPEQVTPAQRVQAKNMLFGLRYGKRAEPEDDPKPALRALAAYDNARHAPSCHPCPGTLAGSGEAEGQGCDEEPKGTP